MAQIDFTPDTQQNTQQTSQINFTPDNQQTPQSQTPNLLASALGIPQYETFAGGANIGFGRNLSDIGKATQAISNAPALVNNPLFGFLGGGMQNLGDYLQQAGQQEVDQGTQTPFLKPLLQGVGEAVPEIAKYGMTSGLGALNMPLWGAFRGGVEPDV